MIRLIKPEFNELTFRQTMLSDEATMSFNAAYGGAIGFPWPRWDGWYRKWIGNGDPRYFYRYLYDDKLLSYVGEVSYHFESETARYLCDVIVYAPYRGRGFGAEGLRLLCEAAKIRGVRVLYDEIALDNPSVSLFAKQGFREVGTDERVCILRKEL